MSFVSLNYVVHRFDAFYGVGGGAPPGPCQTTMPHRFRVTFEQCYN